MRSSARCSAARQPSRRSTATPSADSAPSSTPIARPARASSTSIFTCSRDELWAGRQVVSSRAERLLRTPTAAPATPTRLRITGTSVYDASRLALDLLTSTPRIPTRRAPSMSCVRLSPTITASAAETPASFSAASKMLGCGFMKPCCEDETATSMRPSSSKCSWNASRQRCEFEISPIRMSLGRERLERRRHVVVEQKVLAQRPFLDRSPRRTAPRPRRRLPSPG